MYPTPRKHDAGGRGTGPGANQRSLAQSVVRSLELVLQLALVSAVAVLPVFIYWLLSFVEWHKPFRVALEPPEAVHVPSYSVWQSEVTLALSTPSLFLFLPVSLALFANLSWQRMGFVLAVAVGAVAIYKSIYYTFSLAQEDRNSGWYCIVLHCTVSHGSGCRAEGPSDLTPSPEIRTGPKLRTAPKIRTTTKLGTIPL